VRDGDELVLALPPEPELIAVARLFAAGACRQLGCDEDRIDDVKIAISESVTNAVKAHIEGGITLPIRISIRLEDESIGFEVSDAGPGFDAAAVEGGEALTPPAGLYEGSLGLTLIQALFPDMRIHRNEHRGMTLGFSVEAIPVPSL